MRDGVFFIPFEDFLKQFVYFSIAQVDDEASYIYKSCKDEKLEGVYFAVDIAKSSTYCFQVDKTPFRSFHKDIQQELKKKF